MTTNINVFYQKKITPAISRGEYLNTLFFSNYFH